jgi:two-component system LytT family response regulator
MRALLYRDEDERAPQAMRALLVDPDPESLARIKDLLRIRPEIHVLAECLTASEADQAMRRQPFDLAFVAIELPDDDGLQLVRRIPDPTLPAVILLTTQREHALRAYAAHPADYLLKPVNSDRFMRALDHAVRQVEIRREAQRANETASILSSWGEWIAIKSDHRIILVRTEDIEWIEAAGNYVNVHAKHGKHFVRETMNSIEGKMPRGRFMRIHRSTIVNLARVKEVKTGVNGEYVVLMQNGEALRLSRGYRNQLQRLLV